MDDKEGFDFDKPTVLGESGQPESAKPGIDAQIAAIDREIMELEQARDNFAEEYAKTDLNLRIADLRRQRGELAPPPPIDPEGLSQDLLDRVKEVKEDQE
jgi:hypothetical protein